MATDATMVSFAYQVSVGGYAGGWTESWWNTLAPAAALQKAIDIAPKVMACHANPVRLVSIRCASTDPTLRTASVQIGDDPDIILVDIVGTAGPADFPTTSLLVESFNATSGETTHVWMRGIPDARVVAMEYSPSKAFVTAITELSTAMVNNGFILFKSARAGARQTILDVVQVSGTCNVINHGFTLGSKIRILRAKGIKGLNRSWKLWGITPDTFQLQGWDASKHTGTYLKGSGSCKLYQRETIGMDGLRVVRASKHNIGRGPAVMRGRRRAAKNVVQGR